MPEKSEVHVLAETTNFTRDARLSPKITKKKLGQKIFVVVLWQAGSCPEIPGKHFTFLIPSCKGTVKGSKDPFLITSCEGVETQVQHLHLQTEARVDFWAHNTLGQLSSLLNIADSLWWLRFSVVHLIFHSGPTWKEPPSISGKVPCEPTKIAQEVPPTPSGASLSPPMAMLVSRSEIRQCSPQFGPIS